MTNITKVAEYTVSGKFDVNASIKPDKEATVSKTVTLRFVMDGVALKSIVDRALSSARIAWQNGVGRPKYDTIKNASVIEVNFAAPAKRIETREDKIAKNMASGMDEVVAAYAVDHPEEYAKVVNKYMADAIKAKATE